MPSRITRWSIPRLVPLLAGVMVSLSLVLMLVFSPWWLLLTAFVAANLLLYSFAGWCPASLLMRRLGVPEGDMCPVKDVP